MFVSCKVSVLSGRGLCDRPISHPEESYRLWCVFEFNQVKIKNLNIYCEQVGRRGKDYKIQYLEGEHLTIRVKFNYVNKPYSW
jgi:hypothetical protein